MKYYITTKELAEKIGVDHYRRGNSEYCICNAGDFAAYGLQKAISEGAVEISAKEAKEFIRNGFNFQ